MSTYELDDDAVRRFVDSLLPGDSSTKPLPGVNTVVADALRAQLPVPTPTKIGAVVQTDSPICAPHLSVFIRWASDVQTPEPWELREELDRKTYATKDIGRIVKVLSEGVDL